MAAILKPLDLLPREQLAILRGVSIAVSTAGVAAALFIGLRLKVSAEAKFMFAAFVLSIPALPMMARSVTNDNMVVLAGTLCILGCYRLLDDPEDRAAWPLVAAGLCFGGLVKFTVIASCSVLVAWTLAAHFRWHGWERTRAIPGLRLGLLFCGLGFLPYLWLFLEYGSPAPTPEGLIDLVHNRWFREEKGAELLSLPGVFFELWRGMLTYWTTHGEISQLFRVGTLAVYLVILAGTVMSIGKWRACGRDPLTEIVIGGALSFLVILAMHLAYSYRMHVEFGDLVYGFPRYYFPLIGVMAMAFAAAIDGIPRPRMRKAAAAAATALMVTLHPLVAIPLTSLFF